MTREVKERVQRLAGQALQGKVEKEAKARTGEEHRDRSKKEKVHRGMGHMDRMHTEKEGKPDSSSYTLPQKVVNWALTLSSKPT